MSISIRIIALLTSSASLFAADQAPPAPIPAQILSAKKVFIANSNDDCPAANGKESVCTRNGFYNEFYAAMKTWGQFSLTSSPADAELIFELRFDSFWLPLPDGVNVATESCYRLLIVDPRTHVTVWSFREVPENAGRLSNVLKNYALARAQIVTDLKILLGPADSPQKL